MENNKKYPKFNEQKATEATVLLLKMHGGKMSRVKLMKLLYLSDRKAIENWERPITYDTYYSMREGQVLSGVLNLINNRIKNPLWNKYIERADKISIQLRSEPIKLQKLSRAEQKLLKNIHDEYGHWNRFDLGNLTKEFPEYKKTITRKKTYPKEILTGIYEKEDVERIERQLEEKAYLELALGG
ncbi:MAG TPA: SocA family protein [Anaerolineae bacterium]|nr:SocA family protein [Anaerolineae bacterium]